MDSHFRGCVKIVFVTSTGGRSLKIRTDFSVEDSFEMTFIEFSHKLFSGNYKQVKITFEKHQTFIKVNDEYKIENYDTYRFVIVSAYFFLSFMDD